MRAHPLGLLISSSKADVPQASPLPFLLDTTGGAELGVLRGHLSKTNEHPSPAIGGRLSASRQLESVLRSGCELMRAADGQLCVGAELTELYDIAG